MRIRNLKPEFWRSADVARLPRDLRLLYVGLWSYVDDNGVGVDDYMLIASDLFPRDEDPVETREWVREGLQRLSRESRCVRYEVNGKPFLFVLNWHKHQKVHNPNKPRYPLPCGCVADKVPCEPAGHSVSGPDFQEGLGTSSVESPETPPTGSEGQRVRGSEVKEEKRRQPQPPRDDVEALCSRLKERIEANGAKATVTEKWRTDARLLLDADGRDHTQAMRLVDWATGHEFWAANILSMPKFRAKYDQLLLQARRDQAPQQRFASATDANIAAFLGATGTDGGATIHQLPSGGTQ